MARYIDANKLLEDIGDNSSPIYNAFRIVVKHQPTADVQEVRHGKWELVEDLEVFRDKPFRCSNCISDEWMTESHMRKFNYCPFCGARMDGEE